MLYSCTHMATVGVKGLTVVVYYRITWSICGILAPESRSCYIMHGQETLTLCMSKVRDVAR